MRGGGVGCRVRTVVREGGGCWRVRLFELLRITLNLEGKILIIALILLFHLFKEGVHAYYKYL